MTLRVCSVSGCPELQRETKCPTHRREAEQRRGSRQARGYDANFERDKQRPGYANATRCETCGQPFTTENPKTAGHRIAIREGGKGSGIKPECRRCNYGWRRTNS